MKALNKLVVAAAVAAALGTAAQVQAAEVDKLTVRVRAIYIETANKSDPVTALAVPKDGIDVESKWAPDLDFEYALTESVGLELLLTIPQKHSVVAHPTPSSSVDLGSVTQLPPTLTGKYYFATGAFRPYLGAGLNFTWFTKNDLAVGTTKLGMDSTSIGPAVQAGFDVGLNDNWSLSFDAKRIWMSTDVSLAGTKLTTVHVDPWILGIGVGYRFNKP